jgi:hypothetical protein
MFLSLTGSVLVAQGAEKGYSIPVVDLSGDTARQVVVDRKAGQYLGHPTTVLLEDGKTMLCVYPEGHGKGAIVLKRSMDGGKTWGARESVPDNWATSLETPTIHRTVDDGTVDARGRKRLILFSGLYPIRLSVSEDEGRHWTPLAPIGDFGGIVAMADLVRRANGEYVAFFHDDGRFIAAADSGTRAFTVYQTVSRDGGLTWSKPEVAIRHAEAHLCEPGLVRSPDGREWAMLLRENSRKFNSFVCFSQDEGRSWNGLRELPGALTGDRHVAKYTKDGKVLVTFRDTTRESKTKGDWVAWLGTYEDIRSGKEGLCRVRLMHNTKGQDCAYAGLEVLPDGTVVTTTYGHWSEGEAPYIVSVRFRPEQVLK